MKQILISEELLRQALAQLEINRTNFYKGPSKSMCKCLAGGNDEAITALRTALEQPAVEPVAVGDSKFESWYSTYDPRNKGDKQRARDAYAAGMGQPVQERYKPSDNEGSEP